MGTSSPRFRMDSRTMPGSLRTSSMLITAHLGVFRLQYTPRRRCGNSGPSGAGMTGPYYNWPMPQQHTRLSQYYEELISVPRAHVRMELSQDENGVTLAHDGKALLECRLTRQGMAAAGFMAQALGVSLPALGQAVPVRVSTGVLYRAGAIAGPGLRRGGLLRPLAEASGGGADAEGRFQRLRITPRDRSSSPCRRRGHV